METPGLPTAHTKMANCLRIASQRSASKDVGRNRYADGRRIGRHRREGDGINRRLREAHLANGRKGMTTRDPYDPSISLAQDMDEDESRLENERTIETSQRPWGDLDCATQRLSRLQHRPSHLLYPLASVLAPNSRSCTRQLSSTGAWHIRQKSLHAQRERYLAFVSSKEQPCGQCGCGQAGETRVKSRTQAPGHRSRGTARRHRLDLTSSMFDVPQDDRTGQSS
ncbi:hypothetical protein G7046_g2385 [Stylonectria norvegica]|nr:hypothetical protein G7046_g2385 [Stylonectria norvegica]